MRPKTRDAEQARHIDGGRIRADAQHHRPCTVHQRDIIGGAETHDGATTDGAGKRSGLRGGQGRWCRECRGAFEVRGVGQRRNTRTGRIRGCGRNTTTNKNLPHRDISQLRECRRAAGIHQITDRVTAQPCAALCGNQRGIEATRQSGDTRDAQCAANGRRSCNGDGIGGFDKGKAAVSAQHTRVVKLHLGVAACRGHYRCGRGQEQGAGGQRHPHRARQRRSGGGNGSRRG